MKVGFAAPDLPHLDGLNTDALVLFLHEEETPLPDLRGLVDWRLCGALSRLVLDGRLSGAPGEVLLMPVRGRFPFDRLLVFGLGPRRPLDPATVLEELRRVLRALSRIRVHAAAAALPGRPFGGSDPTTAIEALFQAAPEAPDVDELTVLDTLQAQRAMNAVLEMVRQH